MTSKLINRILVISLFAAILSMTALAADIPSCWIEDACAYGQSMKLLCQEGKVLLRVNDSDGWQERDLPVQDKLRAMEFLDADRGFIVGYNGILLATDDGGHNWRQVSLPTQENLTAIHFAGESGWIVGWGGLILHSSDGGRNWSQQPVSGAQALESVYFTDSLHGWAVGWVGEILRTTDGGRNWEQIKAPEAMWSLKAVYFRDNDNGWAVGFAGQILRSRDGGRNWEEQSSPVGSTLTSVLFDSSNRGWIATIDGLLVSEDDGESWQSVHIDDRLMLVKLISLDGSLYAFGSRVVLKQADGSLAWNRVKSLAPGAGVGDDS